VRLDSAVCAHLNKSEQKEEFDRLLLSVLQSFSEHSLFCLFVVEMYDNQCLIA